VTEVLIFYLGKETAKLEGIYFINNFDIVFKLDENQL
jgi:hypothetical protein